MHWRLCPCPTCQIKRARRVEQTAQAIELRAAGETMPRIAQAVGLNSNSVRLLLKEARGHTASA